jgi:phospholipase D3/4
VSSNGLHYFKLHGRKNQNQNKCIFMWNVTSFLFLAAEERNISIRIAENNQPNLDTDDLSNVKGIEVKSLNFSRLMGGGILHTKLWISDR